MPDLGTDIRSQHYILCILQIFLYHQEEEEYKSLTCRSASLQSRLQRSCAISSRGLPDHDVHDRFVSAAASVEISMLNRNASKGVAERLSLLRIHKRIRIRHGVPFLWGTSVELHQHAAFCHLECRDDGRESERCLGHARQKRK